MLVLSFESGVRDRLADTSYGRIKSVHGGLCEYQHSPGPFARSSQAVGRVHMSLCPSFGSMLINFQFHSRTSFPHLSSSRLSDIAS